MEVNFFAEKKKQTDSAQPLAEDRFDHERNKGLIDRIQSIIRTLSGREGLRVTTDIDPVARMQLLRDGNDPDRTWFHMRRYDRTTKKMQAEYVHVPPIIFESSENVAKGKAAHEAAHAAITRMGEFIPDEVMRELGFGSIMAAIEELPTDETVRQRYEGAGEWVDEARADSIRDVPEGFDKAAATRRMPKFAQLCNLMVYGRHFGEIPAEYDQEVVDFYKKHEKVIRDIEQTIPDEGSSEEGVVEKAKERYKKVYKKIWKEARKFVEQDRKEKKRDEFIKEAQKGEKSGDSQEGGEEGGEDGQSGEDEMQKAIKDMIDKLPEKLKKELKDLLEKAKKEAPKEKGDKEEGEGESESKNGSGEEGGEKGEGEEKEGKGGGESGEEAGDSQEGDASDSSASKGKKSKGKGKEGGSESSQQEDGEQEDAEESEEGDGDEKSASDQDKKQDGKSGNKKSFGRPSSDSTDAGSESGSAGEGESPEKNLEMSEDLQKALDDLIGKMPKDVAETLKRRAEEVLKEVEDRLIKDFKGGLDENPIETHKQRDERMQKEKMAGEHAREMREIEKRIASKTKDSSGYDSVYSEVQKLDRRLYGELEGVFLPNLKSDSSMRITGAKISLPAVFRREADIGAGSKEPTSKIFEVTKHPEKKDYAITILVDLSGSMEEGDKMTETFKGIVLLTEVISRLGIKLEILGFHNDEMLDFKEFSEKLDDEVRKKIGSMPGEVGGDNDDGPSLEKASTRLAQQPGKEKILIILSDGNPSRYSNSSNKLRMAIERITKQTDQKLIGVGLGRSAEHVKDYYPVSLPGISTDELADTLGAMLKDVIENPRKYFG